jgi:hypothetical protein
MESDTYLHRAVKGNPWTIRNSWFMVHYWDRKINPNNMDFKHVQVWIQLWNLPIHCKTINMGKHLGSQLGKVEDAALYDYPQQARIVKIKVNLNVEEPIRPGLFIGNTTDGISWVDFRYENLPMFCFGCGLVGHTEEKDNHLPEQTAAVRMTAAAADTAVAVVDIAAVAAVDIAAAEAVDIVAVERQE